MFKNFLIGLSVALAACSSTPSQPPTTVGDASASLPGMVVAADPRAAEAGRWALNEGGTAADAAMAMMLALTVVEPQSSGIGGGGFLIYHDQRGFIDTIDGRETAPAAANANRFVDGEGKPLPFQEAVRSGLSVGVPGNMRLMARAHERWGRLPWKKLFEPAINLADNGFVVTPALHARLADTDASWKDVPAARAIYYGKDGKPLPIGAEVKNPALARTLSRLAKEGAAGFYQGLGGEAITRAVATAPHHPSLLSAADLAAYRAKDRPALCGQYRGYRICGMGPPSSGATTVIAMLGMLERFDLAAMGPGDPRAWHLIGQAMRLAYADRDQYMADSDFVAVPLAGLIDPGYLAQRSRLISPNASRGSYSAGNPPAAPRRTPGTGVQERGTTHFVAADREGNVASMTSTIEGPFGSQIMANGFFLNNELTDFSFAPSKNGAPVANRVEPGKRPLSSMAPTIVYDANGKVVLALGSAGGRRIIMHVAKTLIGVLDWGLPVAQAMALPNIFFNADGLLVERGTALDAMRPRLAALGDNVVAADLPSKLTALQRTAEGWQGAADPRSEGVALAE